jgi:hypothetical protein
MLLRHWKSGSGQGAIPCCVCLGVRPGGSKIRLCTMKLAKRQIKSVRAGPAGTALQAASALTTPGTLRSNVAATLLRNFIHCTAVSVPDPASGSARTRLFR